MITIVQNRSSGGGGGVEYDLPVGSIILWYGVESTVPYGWEIYTDASDALIMGAADGDISTTKAGALSHSHTLQAITDVAGEHTHTHSGTSNGAGAVLTGYYNYPSKQGSISHSHTYTGAVHTNFSHSHTIPLMESATNIPPSVRLYYIRRTT